jgi:hypothetical protein
MILEKAHSTTTVAVARASEGSAAMFVISPTVSGVTVTSTVAEPPDGMLPRSHSTTSESYPFVGLYGTPSSALPYTVQDPWLGIAETNSTPAGKKSLTIQSRPACGWSESKGFVFVMVKVTGSPKTTLLELTAMSREALRVCAIAVPVLTTSACPKITNKIASRLISFSSLYSLSNALL